MELAEPLRVTRTVVQAFELIGIRYYIGGSLASSIHGIPRATHAVDIIADIKTNQVQKLVDLLQAAFYIDADMVLDAIRRYGSFNMIHLETMLKMDVFIFKNDDVSRAEMSRRRSYRLADDSDDCLFVASAEDIIVNKLVWYQLGGQLSDRQWTDVLGVLKVGRNNLDFGYLEGMATQKNVLSLFRQALDEAY